MALKPFFSITIPTYNRADKLRTALKYLLQQDFKDFEIVISDNCSTDDTKEVVSSFNSIRIKYFKNQKNIDVLPNVRKVISLARGKYIFLHGDDDIVIDKSSLSKIHKIISKTKVGYVRLNYLSIAPDEKHVFDFRASKTYTKDMQIKPRERSMKVIDFLLKSDCSFITGIIFKNNLPKNVTIIDSQLYSWFPIIFYSAKNFGAYYINSTYIIAGWSEWRVRKDNFNPLYSVEKGKLTSEKFFQTVKDSVSDREYRLFLKEQIVNVYVGRFLAIKFFTGNDNLNKLVKRILVLEPSFKNEISFKVKIFIAYITPRLVLSMLRSIYLYVYIKGSSMDSKYNAQRILEV